MDNYPLKPYRLFGAIPIHGIGPIWKSIRSNGLSYKWLINKFSGVSPIVKVEDMGGRFSIFGTIAQLASSVTMLYHQQK